MTNLIIYYWVTFAITLACCAYIPSKLSNGRNVSGSLLAAFCGFAVWIFVLVAAYKTYKNKGR